MILSTGSMYHFSGTEYVMYLECDHISSELECIWGVMGFVSGTIDTTSVIVLDNNRLKHIYFLFDCDNK